jgi:uncharacterized membrane protein
VPVGCVPAPDRLTEDSPKLEERLARIASASAKHFNRGIRAYYFGLAALSWFVDPFSFMLLSAWVVLVLYRREFRSRLLQVLTAVPGRRRPAASPLTRMQDPARSLSPCRCPARPRAVRFGRG